MVVPTRKVFFNETCFVLKITQIVKAGFRNQYKRSFGQIPVTKRLACKARESEKPHTVVDAS